MCKGSTAGYAYRACGILPCEEIKVSPPPQRNAHQEAHPERQTLHPLSFSPMLSSIEISILNIAELCKGSTADSDSVCLGSNPSSAAKNKKDTTRVSFLFFSANRMRTQCFAHRAKLGFGFPAQSGGRSRADGKRGNFRHRRIPYFRG